VRRETHRHAQEFAVSELEDDPILRGIDKNDPVARNPCLSAPRSAVA
jgi:hypothetical protein